MNENRPGPLCLEEPFWLPETGAVANPWNEWKDLPQPGLASTLLELLGPGASCHSSLCHKTSLPLLRPLPFACTPSSFQPPACSISVSHLPGPLSHLPHSLPRPRHQWLWNSFSSHLFLSATVLSCPFLCPPPAHVPLRASFSTQAFICTTLLSGQQVSQTTVPEAFPPPWTPQTPPPPATHRVSHCSPDQEDPGISSGASLHLFPPPHGSFTSPSHLPFPRSGCS